MRIKVPPNEMASWIDWTLCFIADSEAAAGRDILFLVREAVEGGATLIQVRGKKWTSREFVSIGLDIARFLRPKKIPLIINDRVDIVLACQAQGVHLGQDDLPFRSAREILGKKKLIGISVNTPAEAIAAEKEGADYVGAGPMFATSSKNDLPPLLGLAGLQEIRAKIRIPILAIGGINAANANQVISSGADGLAVISAIASSKNPRRAATELIEAIGKINFR